MPDVRFISQGLGFGPFQDVRSRTSLADIFAKTRRSGLYVLLFANGEAYIGRTVDVVRRFAVHRMTHQDIVELAFRPLAANLQDEAERAAIVSFETTGVPLRNIQFASVVLGETDLDLVMPFDDQQSWLRDGQKHVPMKDRVADNNLRRKYRAKFEKLTQERHWRALSEIIRIYGQSCLPAPAITELTFWSVSCLPAVWHGYTDVLTRLNINAQEVFSSFEDDMMLCCTFHIRKSSIESAGQKWPPSVEFDSHHYAPAGHDQIRMTVWDDTPGTIARVIAKPAFKTAAKHLNLQLMRRGANLNARSHSFGVADVIFSSNSPANKVQP